MEFLNLYWDIIVNAYSGYAGYLWSEITFSYSYKPWWENYFYMLTGVSLFFFALELLKPWREGQPKFRKDFWMDAFYMFFNFFLFSLVFYNALYDVFVNLFKDFLGDLGMQNLVAIHIESWSRWVQLLVLFIIRDFIHWNVHRLLHRVSFLWEFHKVHHSVEQMGFAAHLRYHWMENVVYKGLEYIPLAMIGFGIDDFFIVHTLGTAIGHWNHANFTLNIGPLKYLFNNPSMHIWHHAYDIPTDRKYGINFGISLSIWDYMFGTAYIPHNGRDIRLGFPDIENFPKRFVEQNLYGFGKGKS
ncbi:MAG: sterol desaturase family protein [Bacteroidetes bacterium]|nr:sterol desaturase family protein [Bacteroidota bacterium]